MNAGLRAAYSVLGQLARAAAAVAPDRGDKLSRAFAARRGIRKRYAAWTDKRDERRALLWTHAPSVGEGLQARVVIDLVRQRHPDVQIAYTFFSPSAESFAASLNVDFCDFLPFDTAGDMACALNALRPTTLVFSKLDVWPTLCREATRRGIPLGMISGTLAESSSRRGTLAAHVLRDAYRTLHRVGAISEDDAGRLVAAGVRAESIVLAGDTRYDQVWARAHATNAPLFARFQASRPTLVAGSTWPADEHALCAAWPHVRRDLPDARLFIAPHEPTDAHLEPLEEWAAACGLTCAYLDDADATTDVVLVDQLGVLGDLYALAGAAFVGGGFHDAGLHSVLEPAAFGAPVTFGPRHSASRDARILLSSGGADAVATADELTEVLLGWLGDESARAAAGARARAVVERGIGAGERSYRLVAGLLGLSVEGNRE